MKITYIKTGKRINNNTKSDFSIMQKFYDDLKIKSKEGNEKVNHTHEKIVKQDKPKKNSKGVNSVQTIFKKNQLVILSLALMLITAGYMNYSNNDKELNISLAELGDAKLVGANVYKEESSNNQTNESQNILGQENNIETVAPTNSETNRLSNEVKENIDTSEEKDNKENINTSNDADNKENINTSSDIDNKDYFVQTRLDRDNMYSQMLETYQKILENEKIPADQKSIASNEIKNINDRKTAISITENIIKTKGFEDVAILINDNSINVVIKQKTNLNEEQVAQISNIVSRELKAEIVDIHITVKTP